MNVDGVVVVDLAELSPHARETVELIMGAQRLLVLDNGMPRGAVTFEQVADERCAASSGAPLVEAGQGRSEDGDSRRPKIVVVAMALPEQAHAALKDQFGAGFVVMDLTDAPPTADIVLVNSVSPQLVASLRGQFPSADILVTEMSDLELGVDLPGPVTRMMDAGVTGYLPPNTVEHTARSIRQYAEHGGALGRDSEQPMLDSRSKSVE